MWYDARFLSPRPLLTVRGAGAYRALSVGWRLPSGYADGLGGKQVPQNED